MAREGMVPLLKKSRWLLLKRQENLKTEQRLRLRDLLRYNLRTVRAYLPKEAFQQLWDYNSPTLAGKFLADELALYHSLGKLPEPQSTHDLF
jgi:transposase